VIEQFITLFLPAFVTLFVVIDPPGCAPIFASLTQRAKDAHRRAMAIRATVVASVILLVFAFRWVFRWMPFVSQAASCYS
jgi:multiple antibiotic resistance protein